MLKQSWIIGSSDGSTQSELGRAGFTPFTRRTCQNPQFSMTKIKWIDPETSSGWHRPKCSIRVSEMNSE